MHRVGSDTLGRKARMDRPVFMSLYAAKSNGIAGAGEKTNEMAQNLRNLGLQQIPTSFVINPMEI